MNNIEQQNSDKQNFNQFLKSLNLYENDKPLVDFDNIQDEYGDLAGELTIDTKKVKKIIEKTLKQKPKYKKIHNYDVWSFKIKGKGWIIIEKFEESSHMTLKNKWW